MKRLAMHLMRGSGDAGARRSGGRGRRRPDRARLSVLRPARRRARRACRGGASAGGRHAHEGVPRLPRAPRALVDVPLVPMTYASLLEAYGWERFETDARAAGADSLIVADLPADAHAELRRVQLVAPTSTDERIRMAAERTDGWLYLVTVAGHDRRARRPLPRSRRPRRAGASAHRCPTARGLRDLDAGTGARRRSTRRRRRRRLPGAAGRPTAGRKRCAATSRRCDPPWTLRSPSKSPFSIMCLVAGVRWVVRGKDAGSPRIRRYGATEDAASRRRARPRGTALIVKGVLTLLLFDVDGTLFLTPDGLYIDALVESVREVWGHELTAQSFARAEHRPGETAMQGLRHLLLGEGLERATIDAGLARWCSVFSERYVPLLERTPTPHWGGRTAGSGDARRAGP